MTEDSVTLSWLSPERDGGSRIYNYVIEYKEARPGDSWHRIKTVDSSSILVACVEGLREGRPYMFRVYAENSVGAGPPTEVREAIIPKAQVGEGLNYWPNSFLFHHEISAQCKASKHRCKQLYTLFKEQDDSHTTLA